MAKVSIDKSLIIAAQETSSEQPQVIVEQIGQDVREEIAALHKMSAAFYAVGLMFGLAIIESLNASAAKNPSRPDDQSV